MDDIGFWIALLVVFLLWYPFARKRPPATRFLENLNFGRWVIYSIVTTGAVLIIATLIQALGLFAGQEWVILAIATFFIIQAARITMGSPRPNKVTPAQAVGVFAATMVYVWGSTAMVWKWPDSSPWILTSITALFIAGLWAWAYRATRNRNPPA